MSDQGTVSTDDTLERNVINVHTEENLSESAAPASKKQSQTQDKSAESSQDDKAKPKRDRRSEREIRKLRRELGESEARNEEIHGKLSAIEQTVDDLVAGKDTPSRNPAPKLKDFDTEKEFGEAYSAWAEKPEPKAKTKTPEKPPAKRPAKSNREDPFGDERKTLFDTGKERYGDQFAEAMGDKTPIDISFVMRDYLFDNPRNPSNGSSVVANAPGANVGWVWRDKGNGTFMLYPTDMTFLAELAE